MVTFEYAVGNSEVLVGELIRTPCRTPFQPPPPIRTFPLTVTDVKGFPVSPNTPRSRALFDDTLFTRLFSTKMFWPPATRMPLAHQGAIAVLLRIFVPSTWGFVPLAPASEYVAKESSPVFRAKLFCTVMFLPSLSALGVLPLLTLKPSP